MGLMKRALLYISRKRGRSILLLIILFVMSTFLMMGIAVKASTDRAAKELRKSFGSSFILKTDNENPGNYGPPKNVDGYSYRPYIGPMIEQKLIDEIMSVDGVSNYFTDVTKLIWTTLNLRPGAWTEDVQYYQEHPEHLEQHFQTMDQLRLFSHQTTLYCCNDGAMHGLFRSGALEMTEGRNLQEGDRFQAVISEELADRNGLSTGDTFTVENKEGLYRPSEESFKTYGEPIELTVVGLFHINFEQEASPYTYEDGYVENLIFTDMETARLADRNLRTGGKGGTLDGSYEKVTFFVEDPNMLDRVLTEVRSMEKTDGLLLELDDIAYRASVKPLQQISGFSSFLIIASMLGVIIVLYLILTMWTKGRKREIGILLSMGLKKNEIRAQLILEGILVSVIALLLSFTIAEYTISSFGTLAEEMARPEYREEQYTVEMDKHFNPVVEKVSSEPAELEYSLNFHTASLIAALTLGVTAASVWLSSLRALRMQPRDILASV
ncbi:ABC transporter permease [Anaerolentibacter hominis]|uniref:ABC transporter permease n=1 Tax=Anaerolentibacter hominis TaxID=3079009 RepID=UPI0031B7ED89